MKALIKTTSIRELVTHGCQLDGPNGEPLIDDDVFGVRIVRTEQVQMIDTATRVRNGLGDADGVRIFSYDLQTADEDGKWHSVPLDERWIPTLRKIAEAV